MTLNLDAYWMPYTGNRQFKRDPRIIQSAQGVWFTDSDGRQVLDGHSGLWTTGLGHARPEITEAVSRQMAELDFCPPFQFGHPKAFELATKIADLMPGDLNHVFYTNSGSESADTSLKMARAYCCLSSNAIDFAYVGLVYNNFRKINQQPILDSSFVSMSINPRFNSNPIYGYGLWVGKQNNIDFFHYAVIKVSTLLSFQKRM